MIFINLFGLPTGCQRESRTVAWIIQPR